MFCGHNCNYLLYCTKVCSHLVMSFIIMKSLHMDLLIHIFLDGMQMFCGYNCNYNICNYVLYRGLWPSGNVFYHNKLSSYRSTHSYFGWYADVLWAQLVHSVIHLVGRVLLCGHLIIHTVSIHH